MVLTQVLTAVLDFDALNHHPEILPPVPFHNDMSARGDALREVVLVHPAVLELYGDLEVGLPRQALRPRWHRARRVRAHPSHVKPIVRRPV